MVRVRFTDFFCNFQINFPELDIYFCPFFKIPNEIEIKKKNGSFSFGLMHHFTLIYIHSITGNKTICIF